MYYVALAGALIAWTLIVVAFIRGTQLQRAQKRAAMRRLIRRYSA